MVYPIYLHHTNYHVYISDSECQFVYGVCHYYYVSSARFFPIHQRVPIRLKNIYKNQNCKIQIKDIIIYIFIVLHGI